MSDNPATVNQAEDAMLAASPPSPDIAELVEALENAQSVLGEYLDAHMEDSAQHYTDKMNRANGHVDRAIVQIDRALANYRGGK